MEPNKSFVILALLSLCMLLAAGFVHGARQTGQRRAGPVCERAGVAHLACRRGHVIAVTSATWGRRDRRTCTADIEEAYLRDTNCYTDTATRIVQSECDGVRTCTVSATAGVFSDPCPGTYKYLDVVYQCRRGEQRRGAWEEDTRREREDPRREREDPRREREDVRREREDPRRREREDPRRANRNRYNRNYQV